MKVSFRQGILRYQTDTNNNPLFLQKNGQTVNLYVSPDSTIFTATFGQAEYLVTEPTTIISAWAGPFPVGTDYWLYWDISLTTGIRTFGHTIYEPIEQSQPPTGPLIDQHWFDTINRKMKVWNSASWVEKVRVFAAKYTNGTLFQSMSALTPDFRGTQVGLAFPYFSGGIAFDQAGKPIRNSNNTFFTTEDLFTASVPSGSSIKVNTIILNAAAQEPLAAFQVVMLVDYNEILHADPFQQGVNVFGMIEEDAVTSENVRVVTEGILTYDQWDWPAAGADINAFLYCDLTGGLSLTPVLANQIPVGQVVDKQTIIFRPMVLVDDGGGGGGTEDHSALLNLDQDDHPQYFNQARLIAAAGANITIGGSPFTIDVAGGAGSGLDADLWDGEQSNIVLPQDGDMMIYLSGEWVNTPLPPIPTLPVAGTNITIGGSPEAINVSPQGAGSGLNADLWDGEQSNISSPANGEVLTYNAGSWINQSLPTDNEGIAVVQDEGTPVTGTPHDTINFVGAGVDATDGTSGVVTVTIPGGGGGATSRIEDADMDTYIDVESAPDVDTIIMALGDGGDNFGAGTVASFGRASTDIGALDNLTNGGIGGYINITAGDGFHNLFGGVGKGGDVILTAGSSGAISPFGGGDIILQTGGSGNGASGGAVQLLEYTGVQIVSQTTSAAGHLHFMEATDNGTNYIQLKAPAVLGGNEVYTLPINPSAGLFLQTDASGILSWAAAGGGGDTWRIIDSDSDTYVRTESAAAADEDEVVIQLGEQVPVVAQEVARFGRNVTTIKGVDGNNDGAGIELISGGSLGDGYAGGDIDLTTYGTSAVGTGDSFSGNINLTTYSSFYDAGGVNIVTGASSNYAGGDVIITTSGSYGDSGTFGVYLGTSADGYGGEINLIGGNSTTYTGGYVELRGGTGADGGDADLIAGHGTSGYGGWINIRAGNTPSTSHLGGYVNITGGQNQAGASGEAGGPVSITGGSSISGVGGEVSIDGGQGFNNHGGNVLISGGTGGSGTNISGGDVRLFGADAEDFAGEVRIIGGHKTVGGGATLEITRSRIVAGGGSANLDGGDISILGGEYRGAGGGVSGNGGDIEIEAGGGGDTAPDRGGNIVLTPGGASGTGVGGEIITNGPTKIDGVIEFTANAKFVYKISSIGVVGVAPIFHQLNHHYCFVQVYDDTVPANPVLIVPDAVTLIDANNLNVDITSFGSTNITVLVIGIA